jgi:UDP-glucose 4-epimerase
MPVREKKLHVVTGAAGFIGSQLVDRLLNAGYCVFGVDNFTRGTMENLQEASRNANFAFLELDISDSTAFVTALQDDGGRIDVIWHLAANSDISAGGADPAIDLRDTFMTTYSVALACRKFGVRKVAFSSTSAVYGDHGSVALHEDIGPLFPISNYGAMKLASEACLTALSEAALDHLWLFRFPNVVGGRATHGVIYDFLDKLEKTPYELQVLGNGRQCKPYLYIDDLLDAMLLIVDKACERINCFNIGPEDEGVLVRDIAEIVVDKAYRNARITYGAEDRGWVGDVPRFRYAVDKVRALGWVPLCETSREAVEKAVDAQVSDRFKKTA